MYNIGDAIHQDIGLTSQYDEVTLFTFALSIFWALLMAYIIAFGTKTAGSLGLITENNQDWWRVRILGLGGLVLLLSLPGRWNGTNIVLLCMMLIFLEYSLQKSVRASIELVRPNALFDHEGRRRLVSYIDCSCHGVAYPINTSPENTGLLRYQALCDNYEERITSLIRLLKSINWHRHRGCTERHCLRDSRMRSIQRAVNFVDSISSIFRVRSNRPSTIENRNCIQMVNIKDPWTSIQRQSRV